MSKRISLFPNQTEHYNSIKGLLETENFYIDCSLMGSGKTYIATKLAIDLNLAIFVVCPKSMVENWKSICKEYSVKLRGVVTYQSLRGVSKSKKLNHPFLTKHTIGEDSKKVVYQATDKFKRYVRKGLLLIFDEIQYIKNPNLQLDSCIELARTVYKYSPSYKPGPSGAPSAFPAPLAPSGLARALGSKVGLISATPFDKEKHCFSILKLTDITFEDNLFEGGEFGRNMNLTGLKDIIKKCEKINYSKTMSSTFSFYNSKIATKSCFRLFSSVIKPKFTFIMKAPNYNFSSKIMNGHYHINDPRLFEELRDTVDNFRAFYSERKNSKDEMAKSMAMISTFMMNIEKIKVTIMYRLIKSKLKENKNGKVIAYVNYHSSIDYLVTKFREYKPLVLHGGVKNEDRKIINEKFQEHNNSHRLLIGNTKVGGIGLSLHDTHGGFPRTMYIIPTYSILDMHQASGRVCRQGVKSNSNVYFIYTSVLEKSIINSLAKKTKVLKGITEEKILYPSDYPNFKEKH